MDSTYIDTVSVAPFTVTLVQSEAMLVPAGTVLVDSDNPGGCHCVRAPRSSGRAPEAGGWV